MPTNINNLLFIKYYEYEGKEYEGKEYEGKEYEGKEYEGKEYEGKEYEGKEYERAKVGVESDHSLGEFKEVADDALDSIKSGLKAARKKISDL